MASRFLVAACATLILSSSLWANAAPIPQPVVANSVEGRLVVQVDPQLKKPVLKVPASLVTPRQPGAKPGQALLENPALLFAGLALTCAFVSGGFWFLRGPRRRVSALVLCLASMVVAGGSLFADLGIPGRPAPQPPLRPELIALPGMVPLGRDVTLQVYTHPFDKAIYLIVPAATLPEKPTQTPPGKPE